MPLLISERAHHAGMNLDERSLELIRTVLDLEERLTSFTDPLQPLEPWGVAQHLQPVLYTWASGQLGLLQSWTQRLMASEDWKPVTQPRGCARCAPTHTADSPY